MNYKSVPSSASADSDPIFRRKISTMEDETHPSLYDAEVDIVINELMTPFWLLDINSCTCRIQHR